MRRLLVLPLIATPLLVQAASPLPSFATRVQPVVHFLVDSSGSMGGCDAEEITEAQDLTPAPGGGYLYNPRLDTTDDGNCPAGRTAGAAYRINRLEAVKLSISRILDADSNGVIDAADEQLLRLKVGFSQFGTESEVYRTNTNTLRPIGSSFADVWEAARAMVPAGNTPSGPALAGARALSLQNCYDGDANTACDLGPRQNENDGDDIAIGCREYYVIFLTDGEPNTPSSLIPFDPIPVSKDLRQKTKTLQTESMPRGLGSRTIAIGFGGDVDDVGTAPRGVMNCMGYWGGDAVSDGDKDGDGKADKMDDDTDPNTAGSSVTCASMASLSAVEMAYGNGYFASDSRSLSNTFRKILNAIQAGTYSRSEPAITGTASTVASNAVYGSYFEVAPNALEWQGHLKKYLYDAKRIDGNGNPDPKYVDCNNPSSASNPVVPCWDGGARLRTRDWRTRTMYFANVSNLSFAWNTDLAAQARNGWTGTDSSRPQTVKNAIPALSLVNLANPTATGDLLSWAAVASLRDSTHTYAPNDTVPAGALAKALQALSFTAGRPDSSFADGTLRCGNATCTAADPVNKLGDSFNSRAVVVGAPLGLAADPDFAGEFLKRTLTAYTGDEAAKFASGQAASPCPAGVTTCNVGRRRPMVYLAANDGAVHAFDDETGEELWSFVPPSHMTRLAQARSGRSTFIDAPPVVRDVKFPCERDGSGACRAGAQNLPFEDGKWHTLLIYGQGTGGNFYFALDITNPVAPVFLWEYRDPARMGLTLAQAAIAEIPATLPTAAQPGSAVFVSGGYRPNAGDTVAMHSLRPFDGTLLAARATAPADLRDDETIPSALVNGQTGTPRPMDGDGNGKIDRVYVGDREGRMWKACAITATGDFQMAMFFDPALYDQVNGGGFAGQPITSDRPTSGLSDAAARRGLRGPLFFQPDVAFDSNGDLLVAFGSGNLLDPLSPPEDYKNFVWTVKDSRSSAKSCDGAKGTAMADAEGVATVITGGSPRTFEKLIPTTAVLSASPTVFGGRLFYAEFDPDPDGDVCSDDFTSRLIALDVFDSSSPAIPPFKTANGTPTNVRNFPNTVITGIKLDPKNGTLFVQTSTGGNPPSPTTLPEKYAGFGLVGWKVN